MSSDPLHEDLVIQALTLLARRCPRLVRQCYWAGTSSIAVEELHHRESFDLDFHTRKAHVPTSGILAELQQSFPDSFRLVQPPDAFGAGFQGVLTLPSGEDITLEVLSNFEDVPDRDLVASVRVPDVDRVSLVRYAVDKVQCIAERAEARDLVDLGAVLRAKPELEGAVRAALREQDAALIAERLLGWTTEALEADLAGYPGLSVEEAEAIRDRMLEWLRDPERATGGLS